MFVVGNVMSRGNPLVEALLDSGKRYESGPDWLARNVLQADDRWVLGVAGTHGKTTTSSLLAWILEYAGLEPGFLIGGVPLDFDVSARLGAGRHFVIEADEYDTAFFDKRAKFVHYRPRTAMLNNLEHDHADIYPDVASIQKQFHLLLRTVPGNGRLIVNADEPNLAEVLQMGCWTPVERFTGTDTCRAPNGASLRPVATRAIASFEIWRGERCLGRVDWDMLGRHNAANALAAVAAACHAGVDRRRRARGAAPVRRREATARGARRRARHHGLRRLRASPDRDRDHARWRAPPRGAGPRVRGARAALEHHEARHAQGRARASRSPAADRVFVYQSPEVKWDVADAMQPLGALATVQADLSRLIAMLAAEARPGDHLVLMSNGSFGGLHEKLLQGLRDVTP